MRLYQHFACILGLGGQFVKPISRIHSHNRVGCKLPCRHRAELSLQLVEMGLYRRVEISQISQISQKICKLWSPEVADQNMQHNVERSPTECAKENQSDVLLCQGDQLLIGQRPRALSEYAKFAGLRRMSLISPDKMSSEKFDIRQTFHGEMSGENSKCPAKDCRFAGQHVRRGSNEFRVLCCQGTRENGQIKLKFLLEKNVFNVRGQYNVCIQFLALD